MHFQLPQQLQTELLAYDPKLKALVRTQEPKKQSKKSTHPLGNPNDLIPVDVIKASVLQDAIDNINGNLAADRFQIFTKVVDVATPEARTVTIAILYHYEQCWYAAWLPPKGKEDEYLYGYAYAYKDTETAFKMIPRLLKEEQAGISTQKQYGRSTFYVRQAVITIDDVCNSKYDAEVKKWNIPGVASYYKKGSNMYKAISGFEEALRNKIPTWLDSRGIFDRVRTTSIAKLLIDDVPKDVVPNPDQWQPSYESLLQLMTAKSNDMLSFRLGELQVFNSIKHIIDTPYFRRWIQQQCDQCIELYNNSKTERIADIKRPWLTLKTYLNTIISIQSVWTDCPIDYYQNNMDALLGVSFRVMGHEKTANWLRQHMPVASFMHMIVKFYEEKTASVKLREAAYEGRRNYDFNERLGRNVFTFTDFNDATSMLSQVLATKDLEPPKRWRIAEFHDYVQGEAWKIKNPNEGLPQDLFPQPIKVQLDGETWTFFQPYDTHQLSSWGQAVRNCVGSATHYAEDCKKKKHFIVLCMIDGKPQFTIQLTVDMGMMSVKQIAGIANKSLTQEQKDLYTQAFGLALQQRNNELVSA